MQQRDQRGFFATDFVEAHTETYAMPPFTLLIALPLMPVVYLWPGLELPYVLAKTLHVLGMGVIAVLVCRLNRGVWQRGALLAGIFALSALLEWLQYLLPARTGTVEDVGFNLAGCLAGIAAYGIWQTLSARDKAPPPRLGLPRLPG